jgi:hypothetical protein
VANDLINQKCVIVPSSDLGKLQSWNAALHLMRQQNLDRVEELLAKFTDEQLREFAKLLPFDQDAADGVMHLMRLNAVHASPERFQQWVNEKGITDKLIETKRQRLAIYCAVASRYAISKILTEVEALKKAELRKLNIAKQLLTMASATDARLITAALRYSDQDKPV